MQIEKHSKEHKLHSEKCYICGSDLCTKLFCELIAYANPFNGKLYCSKCIEQNAENEKAEIKKNEVKE